jgi:HSP20 family molecular chaperone IbpA
MSNVDRINDILHHPNLSNLVDIYDPVKLIDRALHHPQSILEGRRGFRHDAFVPDFDLRETAEAYFLEGEFPGAAGRESVAIKWIDGKTLHVEGRIDKTDLKKEWSARAGERSSAEDHDGASYATPAKPANAEWEEVAVHKGEEAGDGGHSGKEDGTRTWLSERRAGLYTRTFSFRNAVDADGTQARLSHGLLRVKVPKLDKSGMKSREVFIEDGSV